MPMNPNDYPKDWKWIREQILAQAHYKSEFCGVAHGAFGHRTLAGEWMGADEIESLNSDLGAHYFGDDFDWRMTRIVLTCAHLCHEPKCMDPTHIRALCQKCHLANDRERNAEKTRVTLAKQRLAAVLATGQQTFDGLTTAIEETRQALTAFGAVHIFEGEAPDVR
jgi:hypothetical protein